jgi:hypothetical protein
MVTFGWYALRAATAASDEVVTTEERRLSDRPGYAMVI